MRFSNRREAGRRLGAALTGRPGPGRVVVLGMARGGVPVAAEVAEALGAELDVMVARKLGAPGQPELGAGAVAEGGTVVANREVMQAVGLTDAAVRAAAEREEPELQRRIARYRRGRPLPDLGGAAVVLVDDGLATGVTAEAALLALRRCHPARLVLAAPVCAQETRGRLSSVADEVVCLSTPEPFTAVGLWYVDFTQTTDDEVVEVLDRYRAAHPPSNEPPDQDIRPSI
ncbi:MAG TPA: phosphoribosyltransferase family protein [Acidimicrobiales bacterium]|nr:phosphoribosyltransferase family protein [Acidimicrobiales bacterium]